MGKRILRPEQVYNTNETYSNEKRTKLIMLVVKTNNFSSGPRPNVEYFGIGNLAFALIFQYLYVKEILVFHIFVGAKHIAGLTLNPLNSV